MKKRKWIWLALILLNTAFIWGNSVLNGEQSNVLSDLALKILGVGTGAEAYEPVILGFSFYRLVRKCAHFAEFTALAAWWILWLRDTSARHRGVILLTVWFLTPLIDETIQLFSQRTSSVADLWIDLAGFGLGVLITTAITGRKKKKRK